MSDSHKPKHAARAKENLTKSSPKGAVELSEAALGEASGGAVFPSGPAASSLKIESSLKIDNTAVPNLLLPAVQKP